MKICSKTRDKNYLYSTQWVTILLHFFIVFNVKIE